MNIPKKKWCPFAIIACVRVSFCWCCWLVGWLVEMSELEIPFHSTKWTDERESLMSFKCSMKVNDANRMEGSYDILVCYFFSSSSSSSPSSVFLSCFFFSRACITFDTYVRPEDQKMGEEKKSNNNYETLWHNLQQSIQRNKNTFLHFYCICVYARVQQWKCIRYWWYLLFSSFFAVYFFILVFFLFTLLSRCLYYANESHENEKKTWRKEKHSIVDIVYLYF